VGECKVIEMRSNGMVAQALVGDLPATVEVQDVAWQSSSPGLGCRRKPIPAEFLSVCGFYEQKGLDGNIQLA
jgi:hypothetical protein